MFVPEFIKIDPGKPPFRQTENGMNKHILTLIFALIFAASPWSAFAQNKQIVIDPQKSSLNWEGHRFFGGMHTGTIKLIKGEARLSDGKLAGGEFTIDMNSIKVTDLEGETAERLATHLKTADFFDAENHPVAVFRLRHIDYASENLAAIVGDIVIRGTAQQISFPAAINVKDGLFHASAKGIRVDRTVHDSQYGSLKFFRDLGRKIVHDEFVVHLELFGTVQ